MQGAGRFVAWYEPEHFILETVAPFFVERFGSLVWSIVTPIGSLHWDRETLRTAEAGRRADVPADDAFEAAWRGYYESIFNPSTRQPGRDAAAHAEEVLAQHARNGSHPRAATRGDPAR